MLASVGRAKAARRLDRDAGDRDRHHDAESVRVPGSHAPASRSE
jgi:hypothetical protein